MKTILRALAACLLIGSAIPAAAQKAAEIRQFRPGEPVQINPDKAYVVIRLDTDVFRFTAHILRVPSTDEMAAYDAAKKVAYLKNGAKAGPYESFVFDYKGRPNLFALSPGKRISSDGKLAVVLAEIPVGEYILYGEGFNANLYQCFCFGTVGFKAEAGRVIDLGTMLFAKAWKPSPVPELAGEVNLGQTASMGYFLFAVALRPWRAGDAAAPGIDAATVAPAKLHAVGPFVETNTLLANRLAAIPGVLAYDEGRVIDVASGKEVLPN